MLVALESWLTIYAAGAILPEMIAYFHQDGAGIPTDYLKKYAARLHLPTYIYHSPSLHLALSIVLTIRIRIVTSLTCYNMTGKQR